MNTDERGRDAGLVVDYGVWTLVAGVQLLENLHYGLIPLHRRRVADDPLLGRGDF